MNRAYLILVIVALMFLSFVGGAAIMSWRIFPYKAFDDAFTAAQALYRQETEVGAEPNQFIGLDGSHPQAASDLPSPSEPVGVNRHNPGKAQAGLTVYSAGNAVFPIQLIDMEGAAVHQWILPTDDLSGPALDLQQPDRPAGIGVRRVHLFPNGDVLLVLIYFTSKTPWGLGVVKLDKDSQLIWQYLNAAHHDIDVGPDGRIYILTHSIVREKRQSLIWIDVPFIEDSIEILSPDGELLQKISVLDAISLSDYRAMLTFVDSDAELGDLLHTNSIKIVGEMFAEQFAPAEAGDILLSMRSTDTLVLLDPDSERVTWVLRGSWHMQHDPDMLPNGNILVFDNRGDMSRKGQSRVMEVDPVSLQIRWEFPGDSDEPLYTTTRGSQQRLSNGNTLITESNSGRIVEVTPDRQVAWEYFVPMRTLNAKGQEKSTVLSAYRFSPGELRFEFNLR